MNKILIFLLLVTSSIQLAYGQSGKQERRFSPAQLQQDLNYLKQQLYTVHAYPYTELNKAQYDALFEKINARLTDSLTATDFLKLVKPVIAHLCDEHAQAFLPDTLLSHAYQSGDVFLPFTLIRQGNVYRIGKILSTVPGIQPGDMITKIDGKPIVLALADCSLFTSGYPGQRIEKALSQFGYLYTWSLPGVHHDYTIETGAGRNIAVHGISLKLWKDELGRQTGWDAACTEKISYQKIGDAGYINACSFNIPVKELDSINRKINDVFHQVYNDKVKYLFIDISKNSGGQSVVGDMLINNFYDKPYINFSANFKRSEAYISLLKSWGVTPNNDYIKTPEGKVLHLDADSTFTSQTKPYRFKGKVFIIVGNGTFSSAMMMATIIKDNHIALIAGETPTLGHPNGFGEMYNTKLPNTHIVLLFGVKQWIRPDGKLDDNVLHPDIQLSLTDDRPQLIKLILEKLNIESRE